MPPPLGRDVITHPPLEKWKISEPTFDSVRTDGIIQHREKETTMAPRNETSPVVLAYSEAHTECDSLIIQAIRDMIREEAERVAK